MLHSRSFNNDEINSVSAAPNGRFLAAADDAGDVKVIDASTWQLFKSMRGAHDNICSSAVFRSLLQPSVYSPCVNLCWLLPLSLRLLMQCLLVACWCYSLDEASYNVAFTLDIELKSVCWNDMELACLTRLIMQSSMACMPNT